MKIICRDECAIGKKPLNGNGWTVLTGILFLFMPKCALCWAAYMSLLSSFGLVIHYQPWFLPLTLILFLVTLLKLLFYAIKRKNYMAFLLALIAGLLIMNQKNQAGPDAGKIISVLLMTIAVMMDKFILLYRQLIVRADK